MSQRDSKELSQMYYDHHQSSNFPGQIITENMIEEDLKNSMILDSIPQQL
jgi:hypothetical protein